MSLLIDDKSFTGNISKMVELSEEFIINGYRYNKYDISLVNNEIANFLAAENQMFLKKMMLPLKSGYGNEIEIKCGWVRDISDENIHYVITNCPKNSEDLYIRIVKTSDTDIKIKDIELEASYYSTGNIIYQDKTYLYVSTYTPTSETATYGTIKLYKINKETYEKTSFSSSYTGCYPKIYDVDDDNCFYMVFYYNLNIYIYKFNINTGLLKNTTLQLISSSFSYNIAVVCSEIDTDNNSIYLSYPTDDETTIWSIYRINLNDFSYNKLDFGDELNSGDRKLSSNKTLRCEYFNINDKKYLVVGSTVYTRYYSTNTDANVIFYLYQIKNDKLYLIDTYNEEGIAYTNLMFVPDKQMMIFFKYTKFDIVIINSDIKFENTFSESLKYLCCGIGNDNKIYLQYEDKSVQDMVIGKGIKIYSNFEKDVYGFYNSDIESYLEIYSRDILGNYGSGDVIITIFGNAIFTDGSKGKKVYLSKNGILTVPILIKGQGKLEVYTEFV